MIEIEILTGMVGRRGPQKYSYTREFFSFSKRFLGAVSVQYFSVALLPLQYHPANHILPVYVLIYIHSIIFFFFADILYGTLCVVCAYVIDKYQQIKIIN